MVAVVSSCAVNAAASTTTLAPLPVTATTTTTLALAVRASDVEGVVAAVRDGRTLDLQVGPTTRLVRLAHITVPSATTCEGIEAKQLLAAIVIGHKVRLDDDGIVWRDDLDVAKAMVSFGMANASDDLYAAADGSSIDVSCAIGTSTTRPQPAGSPPTKPTTTGSRPSGTTPPPTRTQPAPPHG